MQKIVFFSLFLISSCMGYGQLQNLSVEVIENEGKVKGKTYLLYANLTDSADKILVVYADTLHPLVIKSNKPFYQSPLGGPLAKDSNRKLVSENPSVRYDSWITIGGDDNYDCSINFLTIDFKDFEEKGAAIVIPRDGAWYTIPTDHASTAGSDKKVLLGQFTTEGNLEGSLSLMGRDKSGTTFYSKGVTFQSKGKKTK
jgi:hypothetical protein